MACGKHVEHVPNFGVKRSMEPVNTCAPALVHLRKNCANSRKYVVLRYFCTWTNILLHKLWQTQAAFIAMLQIMDDTVKVTIAATIKTSHNKIR